MADIARFQSCTAVSCARQLTGPKKASNYIIAEKCRHSASGQCPFPDKKIDKKVNNAN